MEKLTFSNILMDRVMCPFVFNMYYFCGKLGKEPWVSDPAPAPVDGGTPVIRDMNINNITVVGATSCAGVLAGLPEQNIENIAFSNCNITMLDNGQGYVPAMMSRIEPMQAGGFVISNAKGITFNHVKLHDVKGERYIVDEVSDVKVDGGTVQHK